MCLSLQGNEQQEDLYDVSTVKRQLMNICLFGPRKAGRSSLIDSLRGLCLTTEPVQQQEQAVCFRGVKANIPVVGKVSLCDVSIQRDFYKILGLISQPNTILILLLNLVKSELDLRSNALSWLSSLREGTDHNTTPTVLMTASHLDEVHDGQDTLQSVVDDICGLFKSERRKIDIKSHSFALDCRKSQSAEMNQL